MSAARGGLMGSGDPSPIHVPGRPPAVLAFHGFGGTPFEVALVADAAKELGLEVHAPLLPGHGTDAHDLARTGFREWSDAARAALERIAAPGAPAIVVGLSLGSLLAAHLAATVPDRVLGLAMLANATRLSPLTTAWPLRVVDALHLPDFSVPKVTADIADPEARKDHLTYGLQPVRAAIEVLKAGARVEKRLGDVHCPALVAHGLHDHVCPVENAERVLRLLGSKDKRLVVLPRSFHIVTRDYDRETLRGELLRFFQRLSAKAAALHTQNGKRAHTPVEP
jgi:carboxylesterase